MALCGWPGGVPAAPPWQLAARLAFLAREIHRFSARQGRPVRVSWEAAVAGRAAFLGLGRRGRTSPNGSCRLLRTADGWVALNLPRPSDADLIPALTGPISSPTRQPGSDAWGEAEAWASVTPAAEFAARARLLGLATAPLATPARAAPVATHRRWDVRRFRPDEPWRVVDLSSLWAGPLAARVLAEAGAAVTKLESLTRPDGARATPDFYRWLHPADEAVVEVDFATAAGRRAAADLIDHADVVIEASRPRALEQLGLGPDDRPDRPGRVWLSITGHGREAPGRDWIAFGDDAAVAGGLVARDAGGDPVFCGDAIADPLSGLTGALAVLEARADGGGRLIDLAMGRAAAAAAGPLSGSPGGPGSGGPGGPGSGSPGVPGSGGPGVVESDGSGGWLVRLGPRGEAVRARPEHLDLILPAQS
jgi:hypothetical protein